MISKIIEEVCSDVASGYATEATITRLLRSSLMLYPRLLDVELRVIKDILDMRKHPGRNEYEKYNLTSGILKAEGGLADIQDKILAMENTILALRGMLGEKIPFIIRTDDMPILLYQVCPSRLLFEESKKVFERSRTQ